MPSDTTLTSPTSSGAVLLEEFEEERKERTIANPGIKEAFFVKDPIYWFFLFFFIIIRELSYSYYRTGFTFFTYDIM